MSLTASLILAFCCVVFLGFAATLALLEEPGRTRWRRQRAQRIAAGVGLGGTVWVALTFAGVLISPQPSTTRSILLAVAFAAGGITALAAALIVDRHSEIERTALRLGGNGVEAAASESSGSRSAHGAGRPAASGRGATDDTLAEVSPLGLGEEVSS